MIILNTGCSHAQKCALVSEEPVSACRAQSACGKGSAALFFGTVLSGAGAGLSHQKNQTTEQYNRCVQDDLEAQEASAARERNRIVCDVEETTSGNFRSVCK